jgi:orotidine-5'-phosphate decarboxylase
MNDPKKIIVALDYSSENSALHLLSLLDPTFCRVKIGKELFTRYGPDLVRKVTHLGFEVFLDLKFHDIPNTVAGAISAAADLGVWMVNVHAAGGRSMLAAARKVITEKMPIKLVAVTVLTSLSPLDLQETGVLGLPEQQVLRLAGMAADCGLDGVVCSANEIELLRLNLPTKFLLVTPGIRPLGDNPGDQKRIETPARALAKGSDYLVIGRPITQASDPSQKLQEILLEIQGKI